MPTPGRAIPAEVVTVIGDSAAGGYQIAAQSGPAAGAIVVTIQTSVIDGYATSMWAECAVLVLGAVYVGLRAPCEAAAAFDEPAVEVDPA